MVSRIHRLSRDTDFRYVFRRGHRFASPAITFVVVANKKGTARWGVVVGTNVAKRAHERNLLRRRLFEYIRTHVALLTPAIDGVLILRPAALKLTRRNLYKEVQMLFIRAGLLKNK